MSRYSLTHVPDPVLLRDLAALVTRERATTAALLAHLAEVDARRLYAPAGHPSMFSYCVHELHFSEEAAYKRIRVARAARQFPVIFQALAAGRLHGSAVVMLAPHLTPENAEELLSAAAHRSRAGIEELLAQRFPRPDLPVRLAAISPPLSLAQLSPGTVEAHGPGELQLSPGRVELPPTGQPSPGTVDQHAPGRVEAPAPPPKVTPLSPQRYALQLTVGQSTYEKLRYAQDLLGHQLPSGDLAKVLDRALAALIEQLERRKIAATSRPRPGGRPSRNPRHIPAQVKRAVWERDGGRCTFVSDTGQRCPARRLLEYDHVQEVARGGRASVAGIRLRCRSHNQYGAECAFGAGFMRHKREEARRTATARRAAAVARAAAERARAADEARRKAAEGVEAGPSHSTEGDCARRCHPRPHDSLKSPSTRATDLPTPSPCSRSRPGGGR